jgi:hypothetical protein
MNLQNSTRLFAASVLCGVLSACGAGGGSTVDAGVETSPVAGIENGDNSSAIDNTATVTSVTPSVTVTEPDNTPDSGNSTAGGIDTTATTEPVVSEPAIGNAHDSELSDIQEFTVKLESVTVRRRSSGEVLPVEISHISSGLLTIGQDVKQ